MLAIYKILLFIFIISLMLTSCTDKRDIWTEAYKQQTAANLNHSLAHIVPDSSKRTEMVKHVVKQLEKEFPEGLESISTVSLHNITYKIERDYALSKGHPQTAVPWTDMNEENLRLALVEQYAQKVPNPNLRTAFCNCLITQLKARQPDSLRTPIADTTLTALTAACN